jgi:hypothetical protein
VTRRKSLLFLKKKKQEDFCSLAASVWVGGWTLGWCGLAGAGVLLLACLFLPALAAQAQDLPQPINIQIVTNGKIAWNGLAMTETAFAHKLAELRGRKALIDMRIIPSKGATHGQVARVMTIAQRYGVNIGLVGNERSP